MLFDVQSKRGCRSSAKHHSFGSLWTSLFQLNNYKAMMIMSIKYFYIKQKAGRRKFVYRIYKTNWKVSEFVCSYPTEDAAKAKVKQLTEEERRPKLWRLIIGVNVMLALMKRSANKRPKGWKSRENLLQHLWQAQYSICAVNFKNWTIMNERFGYCCLCTRKGDCRKCYRGSHFVPDPNKHGEREDY